MDFSDALKVLWRRWYVVVVGVTLMVGLGASTASRVATEFQASGQVLLLPPQVPPAEGAAMNPFLGVDGGMTLTASLIAGTMTLPDTARELTAEGFTSFYTVSVVPQTGPLISITTKDTDPERAVATRDEIVRRAGDYLSTIQAEEFVPDDQFISVRPFNETNQAEVLAGAKVRALALVVAVGTMLTALTTFALDRWLTSRQHARHEAPGRLHRNAPVQETGTHGDNSIDMSRAKESVVASRDHLRTARRVEHQTVTLARSRASGD